MPRHPCADCQQHQLDPEPVDQKERSEQGRRPHHAQGDDFRAQRNGFIFHIIANVSAEIPVAHHAAIEPVGTADIKPAGKQPERGGRKQRDENADRPQHQEKAS